VVALEIDPLQLEQGQFDLRTLELVFPTGELLIHGSDGPVNATIQTREIPKVAEARLKVYVGVRRVREHESNVGEPGEDEFDPPRYNRVSRAVSDLNTGRNLVDVDFQQLNVRVFFEGDRMDGFECVPVAELVAPAVGLPLTRLSPTFAPPSLRVSAAATVHAAVREIYAEAAGKASELGSAATISDVVAGSATEAELVQLLKLHTLRGALPLLREAADGGLLHPFPIYLELCALLGQFVTFSEGATLPNVPRYDHRNVGECYQQVAQALLTLLRTDQLAANFKRIALRGFNVPFGGLGVGAQGLDDQWLRGRNVFYIAFNDPGGAGTERDWYKSGHVKVSSFSRIANVVAQRKYRVPLVPCAKPRALPARDGAVYYRLDTQGGGRAEIKAEWDAVVREQMLAIHFATEGLRPGQAAPDLGIECYVVFGK
jgi:type VI secretion system protein ImpJ